MSKENGICYLCGVVFDENNNHPEHIIHNALGGKLKAKNVLCDECGNKLGSTIDKDFCNIFFPLTARINIVRDSPLNNSSIKGRLILDNNERIDVIYDKGNIRYAGFKCDVDEANKTINVLGLKTTYDRFSIKLKKEFETKGLNIDDFEDNIKESLEGIVEFNFTVNNEALNLGLNKIACDFAAYNNIQREDLTHVLDLSNNSFKEVQNIVPYYPFSELEAAIELTRCDLSL